MITKNVREQNVREMLLALGVQPFLVEMSIPFVWFLPGTVDPDSASVIEIIKAIQRGLNRAGYSLSVNGVLNIKTADALDQVAPGWHEKSLIQIVGDVMTAYQNPDRVLGPAHAAMGLGEYGPMPGYFQYHGAAPGPLPGWMMGLPPGPLGSTETEAGVMDPANIPLSFGEGIVTKTNMVPIDAITRQIFGDLQRQVNRLLSVLNPSGAVVEDTVLGTGTLDAVKRVGYQFDTTTPANTMAMASMAFTLAAELGGKADALGVSPDANRMPGYSTVPIPTKKVTQGQANKALKGDANVWMLLIAAAGVAWYASRSK